MLFIRQLMKCIFCDTRINDSNKSEEHIVPKFLGGKFTIDIVCKSCNNDIGKNFEQKMSEDPLIKLILSYFHIKSGSRNQVTPNIKFWDDRMTIRINERKFFFMHTEREISFDEDEGILHIEVDETTPQEEIDEIINNKVKNLEMNTGKKYSVTILRDDVILEEEEPENIPIDINLDLFGRLFVKIAYEFACLNLDSSFLNDERAIFLKEIILGTQNVGGLLLNAVNPNIEKITQCINEVSKNASDNTKSQHYNNELAPVSNGDYTHEISLIKRDGLLFVSINLFDLIDCVILVSSNGDRYDLNDDNQIKLITGIENGEVVNKLI